MSPDTRPDWLIKEHQRIEARRANLNLPDGAKPGDGGGPRTPVTGLALSGGGIRSATLSLGMLQALARANALRQFDYLSTVSGGGYAGSFLCSLLMPEQTRQGHKTPPTADELNTAFNDGVAKLSAIEQRTKASPPAAHPIHWLRSSGRYLAPNGAGDVWFGFTLWLRNLLAVHYVLGVTLVSVLVLFGLLNHLATGSLSGLLGAGQVTVPLTVPDWAEAGLLYGVLALLVLVAALLPLGVAYWYTEMPKGKLTGWWAGILTKTALIGMLMGPVLWFSWFCWGASGLLAPWKNFVVQVLTVILVLAGIWYVGAWTRTCSTDAHGRPSAWMQVTRTRLTRYLSLALGCFIGLLVLGLVLAVCNQLVTLLSENPLSGLGGASVLSVLLGAWKLLPGKASAPNKPLSIQWLTLLGALFLGLVLVLFWGTVAAWLVGTAWSAVAWYAIATLMLMAWITGETFQFLNLSTIQNLYTARLVRAYLGATNGVRGVSAHGRDMTAAHAHDDLALAQYYGAAGNQVQLTSLAPVHLINVTINETVAPQGSLVNQDRKGLPLSITPDGYLVDGQFYLRPSEEASKSLPRFELLSLGRWIGISGAAFGPGLGRGTRPERSLLMVLTNVRLGYWWQVAGLPGPQFKQRPFSTQLHLFREARGRFYGTDDSHWYLSDGGHFENTGVYELLRRRVDFILALDNGADKAYQYEDMANLMRLACVDLGARFTPITPEALANKLKGTPQAGLADMLGDPNGFACDAGQKLNFLLAYKVQLPVTDGFATEHTSTLLWVKPRLTEQASLDLRQYQATHPDFPQESTADQFFDDQQWESYRKLGQHAGDVLLSDALWQGAGLGGLIKALED